MADTRQVPGPNAAAARDPIRLLLVEDDPVDAAHLREILTSVDEVKFEIEQASHVEEGLQMLRDGAFQVVLLDLSLEEGDGLDTLSRAKVAAASVPIIAMTSQGNEVQALKALRVGAQDYLVKGESEPRLVVRTVLYAVERHRILTDLALARQREHYIATHDSLTGLPNRAAFMDQLQRSIAYAARNQTQVSLLFVDVDRFKNINDSMGHQVGDELLRVVSTRLQDVVRRSDMLGRLGGDEFIVLLQDVQRDHDPARVSQKILDTLSRPCSLNGAEYRVTASVGIAVYPSDGMSADVLIKNADLAMYHAKSVGRNRYSYYAKDMDDQVATSLDMENGLRLALEHHSLLVHYQPQVHVGKGIIGAEALVRWRCPNRGMVSPATFIPMAEETGLIHPIGAWVLRTACEQAVAWQGAGRGIRVAVNVSTRQLASSSFADEVSTTLRETGLDPRRLELEITESSVLEEQGVTLGTIRLVRQLGVRVAIDDFGTGYSALSALRNLPVDALKIDRSFVSDLDSDPSVRTITTSLIDLATGLGLDVTAEGVENTGQMRFLESRGCHDMQGFLFSRPMPAEEFARQLQTPVPPWQEALSTSIE